MHKCLQITILFYLVLVTPLLKAKELGNQIATLSPISHSLTQALVKNTDLKVSYLPPKRLPINRIVSWVNKHKTKRYPSFDVVVTMRSVMPKLDMFASLRQSNIHLVEVDIANAILPKGERVVVAKNGEYFWLNTNNLLLMLGILKRDLILLWPNHKAVLARNFQSLSGQIRALNLDVDSLLMANDVAFIAFQNSKLSPLSASLASDKSTITEAQSFALPFLVVSNAKSDNTLPTWQIDSFTKFKAQPLLERLQSNQLALKDALTQL